MEIKKKLAPFGIRSKRFQRVGFHPGFFKGSGTRRFPCVAPGSYELTFPEKCSFPSGWSKSLETEEFSKNLGWFAPDLLKEKARAKGFNGPGWHDYNSPAESIKITFSKGKRFAEPRRVDTPGPGFYRKHGRSFCYSGSEVPSFEWSHFNNKDSNAFNFSLLPPNLYKVSGFPDRLFSKVVSKRGPYDTFTGPRDETTLYGHFRKSARNRVDALYDFPGGTDTLKCRRNAQKGKFMRCGRDAVPPIRSYKKTSDGPGPAHYYLPSLFDKSKFESPYPFGSSLLYSRPPTKIGLKPGPGRYGNNEAYRVIKGNGWKSLFESKTKRGGLPPDKNSWFE